MTPPLKVLCCGDVSGRFAPWLKRLESVHSKAGPFDMALCVGSFFSPENSTQEDLSVWKEVEAGKRTPPVPVYILGPNQQPETSFYKDLGGHEVCENVVYLGTHGCYTTKEGLRVAYLSGGSEGPEDRWQFAYPRMKELKTGMRWDDSGYVGVDVLLTSQWPLGIGDQQCRVTADDGASPLLAKAAASLRPRYHFCGMQGKHFERRPYRNHRVLNEPPRHVTRFIALAKVANKEKLKWLYAFNVVPLTAMDKKELTAQPADATDSPYTGKELENIGGEDPRGQFFYDMNAPVEDDKKGRKRRSDSGFRQPKRPREPTGPCWFCLSGPQVEKHLVVSIGDHAYMALAKGGLTPEHVMILPIAHYASSMDIPEEVEKEVSKFKSALKKCFKKRGKAVVFYERNYKSHHLQLQCVPIPRECTDSVKTVFQDVAENYRLELSDVPEYSSLTQMTEPGSPYFYAELPSGDRLYHRVRSGFPIQFGREVLASKSLLDQEDRVDWRQCKQSQDEEVTTTKGFRTTFAPYDFTLEED